MPHLSDQLGVHLLKVHHHYQSIVNMTLHEYVPYLLSPQLYLFAAALVFASLGVKIAYRLSPYHPLHNVPGPFLAKMSSLWLVYYSNTGKECTQMHIEHGRHGNLVRSGPNSVHIQSGRALHDIYTGSAATDTAGQGFLKPNFYRNFDIDGHQTVFSATDPEHRAPRARAMTPIFSSAALRRGADVLDSCSKRMVARMEREKARAAERDGALAGTVDILNVTRGLAIDVISEYLFGTLYGGCDEDLVYEDLVGTTKKNNNNIKGPQQLTASAFVHAFASIGRLWYLERGVFNWVNWFCDTVSPDHEALVSQRKVDDFVWGVVDQAEQLPLVEGKVPDAGTFQTRLLSASIAPQEIHAHCKDLIFAGTDSTPMNLAFMMHCLAGHPTMQARLRAEMDASDPRANPETLPVLRAVVTEGLRLAMANPTRLVRVVPRSGWVYDGQYFPPGTHVGCSMWELHHNPAVFPDPLAYRPERWLDAGGDQLDVMKRDCMPFGMGARGCIARNLATAELYWAMREVARRGILEGATPLGKVSVVEWFNARVVNDKIELKYGTA